MAWFGPSLAARLAPSPAPTVAVPCASEPPPAPPLPAPPASPPPPTGRVAAAEQRDLTAAARLRAACYFSGDASRFRETLEAQFADREAQRLRRLTWPLDADGIPAVVCLVFSDPDGEVLGTLDVRPPRGVVGDPLDANPAPAGCVRGAYLQNVAVAPRARGRGVARSLVSAALRLCVDGWDGACGLVWCHVNADNVAARRLYESAGFVPADPSGAFPDPGTGGGEILLVRELVSSSQTAEEGVAVGVEERDGGGIEVRGAGSRS